MALLTPTQFNAWRVAKGRPALSGTDLRDAYWQYRANFGDPVPGSPQAATAPPAPAPGPTVTPRPGPTPGTLDARGEEDIAGLNEWRRMEAADIDAGLERGGLDYQDSVRRAGTARDEGIRRTIGRFTARGLLRSGLRAGGEAQVEAGHVDTLSNLGRRWGDIQAAGTRAKDRLKATFGARERDAYRGSFDRLLAEFNATGGSTVTDTAPPVGGSSSAPPTPAGTAPVVRPKPPKRPAPRKLPTPRPIARVKRP